MTSYELGQKMSQVLDRIPKPIRYIGGLVITICYKLVALFDYLIRALDSLLRAMSRSKPVFYTVVIVLALVVTGAVNHSRLKAEQEIAERKAEADREADRARQEAEQARYNALTPAERQREAAERERDAKRLELIRAQAAKEYEFTKEREARGILLTMQIKAAAFDPNALMIRDPVYYSNGVCVTANGKNKFGGYVGWKEYCYIVNKKGVWTLQE